MNRTGIFLAVAGLLALVAIVVGLPRSVSSGAGAVAMAPPIAAPVNSNAFNGSLTLATRVSHPMVGLGSSDVFVTADVTGVPMPRAERSAVNLALVIDRSGSMSGFKLTQAKQAAQQLVAQLTEQDRLSVVHYGSDVKALDGLRATAENKRTMLKYIDGIWDDGGTNIAEGLTTGREKLKGAMSEFTVNRLILISDGQPTEGLTESGALMEVVQGIRREGISVSSIGVGSDFNEELMAAFAQIGGGAYAYLQDAAQLSGIFQKDLNAATTQVARNVTLSFAVPAGTVFVQALGYQVAGAGEMVKITLPDFAAGQVERVVVQLRVTGSTDGQLLTAAMSTLDYTDLLAHRVVTTQNTTSVRVTSDGELVLRNRDKDAMVYAARARAGVNTQNAVEALKQGDRSRAETLMRANALFFDEAASSAGAEAVKGDVSQQNDLLRAFNGARDDAEVNEFSKDARKKARVNYGLIGSTY